MEIKELNLNNDQLDFCMGAINHFGSGQHPMADKNTIKYFKTKYLIQCMDKAIKKNGVSEFGIETITTIKQKINEIKKLETCN